MNKEKYLSELRSRLSMLPDEEREAAIKYYEEYFIDAGPEKEEQVIHELGSIDEVVKTILKENGVEQNEENEVKQGTVTNSVSSEKQNNRVGWLILIIILIFFLPVIFPLLISVIAICFGFLCAGIRNINRCYMFICFCNSYTIWFTSTWSFTSSEYHLCLLHLELYLLC